MSRKLRISLEAARVNANLTQRQVCKELGISLPTIVYWEKGVRIPTVDNATKLAKLYGVTLDDINFQRNS